MIASQSLAPATTTLQAAVQIVLETLISLGS